MKWLFRLAMFCLLFTQCKPSKSLNNSTFYYSDQNNNSYSISAEALNYNPISSEESSSGSYSGGKKASIKISEETFTLLSNQANKLLASGPRSEKRAMLTSMLSRRTNDETTRVILTKSDLRSEFEKSLLTILQKDQ